MAEDQARLAGGELFAPLPEAEADLLKQLRGGDAAAGQRFVRDYYPAVYRYLLYLTGHRETAEDLTQETFLQAWRHLDQFQGRAPLRVWLHQIARREFLRAKRRRQVADLYLEQEFKQPAPRPRRPRRVKVDPQLFAAYVGDYRLSPGRLLSVTQDEGRLMVQPTRDEKREAHPTSKSSFFVKETNARLRFDRPRRGQSTQALLSYGGTEMPAQRVQRAELGPEQMAEYTGDYYGDELGAVYTVSVREGQLMLTHRRWEPVLHPTIAHEFASDVGTITFTRGRAKRINGLLVDTGRIRKLRFVKAANGRIQLRDAT